MFQLACEKKQSGLDPVPASLHLLCQCFCPAAFQLSCWPTTHHALTFSRHYVFMLGLPPAVPVIPSVSSTTPSLPVCVVTLKILTRLHTFHPGLKTCGAESFPRLRLGSRCSDTRLTFNKLLGEREAK